MGAHLPRNKGFKTKDQKAPATGKAVNPSSRPRNQPITTREKKKKKIPSIAAEGKGGKGGVDSENRQIKTFRRKQLKFDQ